MSFRAIRNLETINKNKKIAAVDDRWYSWEKKPISNDKTNKLYTLDGRNLENCGSVANEVSFIQGYWKRKVLLEVLDGYDREIIRDAINNKEGEKGKQKKNATGGGR